MNNIFLKTVKWPKAKEKELCFQGTQQTEGGEKYWVEDESIQSTVTKTQTEKNSK